MKTPDLILKKSKELFTQKGDMLSMRTLAHACKIQPSVLYYHFKNKEDLLRTAFDRTCKKLGELRKELPDLTDPIMMLRQRIEFQFDNAGDIMFVLKYYVEYRADFKKHALGFIPNSHVHIREVLEEGVKQKVFKIKNIDHDALVIAHAINGFVMEYYPQVPKGKSRVELVDMIQSFIIRAIT
ncbi:MAG: TetR/AcrR family transcriptional regulator [Weeksellaceae bacterium]